MLIPLYLFTCFSLLLVWLVHALNNPLIIRVNVKKSLQVKLKISLRMYMRRLFQSSHVEWLKIWLVHALTHLLNLKCNHFASAVQVEHRYDWTAVMYKHHNNVNCVICRCCITHVDLITWDWLTGSVWNGFGHIWGNSQIWPSQCQLRTELISCQQLCCIIQQSKRPNYVIKYWFLCILLKILQNLCTWCRLCYNLLYIQHKFCRKLLVSKITKDHLLALRLEICKLASST